MPPTATAALAMLLSHVAVSLVRSLWTRLLDRMESDTERQDGRDAELSLAAPENHHSAQITWLRGNEQKREADVPETPVPGAVPWPFPWTGASNVISAAGTALLDRIAER
ncbi:hypothetical protein [Methylobacterium trifolii]|uniref:hypothetical protein n=1 Tax=Methylobacterium trifolii TaxID=1003092 RepID=UPI001EDF82D5|nr:hypothetical protein [Methylobacterium trifolii]